MALGQDSDHGSAQALAQSWAHGFAPAAGDADADDMAPALVECALKSGAEAAEVLQTQSWDCPVFFEGNRLKQLERSAALGVGLRLWRNGRPGLAVAYGPVEPQTIVDKALALSQLNSPEAVDLAPGGSQQYADLGQRVPVDTLIDWGQALIDPVRQAYPEAICEVELDCDTEATRIVNSHGLDYRYRDTTLTAYLSVDWVRGDDFLTVGGDQVQRDSLTLDGLVAGVLQRLRWAERGTIVPSGRMPVLFTPQAADLLWGTVQAALSGKRVQEQSSPWSDSLGDTVTATALTLTQDPTRGPYSCPFDDEGTPTQPLTFIENGVLRLFYCDRRTGRDLGGGSTGNGFRPGLGSYPTPSLINTLVQPGQRSFADLLASLDEGIVVDQVLGGGAGIAGDFSVSIDLGYRVRQGQVVGRIKDTMLAGNVYAALKAGLELGRDSQWVGSCYTPSVRVEGLSVIS